MTTFKFSFDHYRDLIDAVLGAQNAQRIVGRNSKRGAPSEFAIYASIRAYHMAMADLRCYEMYFMDEVRKYNSYRWSMLKVWNPDVKE